MNIMNMMWFMGMCLLSTVIIGGFFIHRDNKRNAAANKKDSLQRKAERYTSLIKLYMGRGPVKHSLAGPFLFYYPPFLFNI